MTPPPRLIADINVLMAVVLGAPDSLAGKLYARFLKAEVRLVFSADLLNEIERVASYPKIIQKGMNPTLAFKLARDFYELGEYCPQVEHFDWPTLEDRKDWYLLDLLFGSVADGLIAQDTKLLRAGKTLEMPVFHLSEGPEQGWF